MAFAVAAWIVLSGIGLLLLVLPESGPRIFSISNDHGPSAVDLAGVLVLLTAWAIPATVIWRGRHTLWHSRTGATLAVVALLSVTLLVVSVLGDLGSLWVWAAMALALVQILAFISIVRSADTHCAQSPGSAR